MGEFAINPTPARLALMRAIAADEVRWYRHQPCPALLLVLWLGGLTTVGFRHWWETAASAPVSLTQAGRRWLAEHDHLPSRHEDLRRTGVLTASRS